MFHHGGVGPMGHEVIERTGAILAGRRGYDLGTRPVSGPRAIYGGGWAGPSSSSPIGPRTHAAA
jgi:hypothetical protein